MIFYFFKLSHWSIVTPRYVTVFDHFSGVLFKMSWLMLLLRGLLLNKTDMDLDAFIISRHLVNQ